MNVEVSGSVSNLVNRTRRQLLLGGVALACAMSRTSRADSTASKTTQVAPGIHVRRGADEDASARNDGGIANLSFIVGKDAIAVVDPGGSLADGRHLRARILEVSALPIRFVIMTHGHPDHVFGAGAFADDRPQFVGHARLPNAIAQRGEYYRAGLEKIVGRERTGPVITPTRLVEHTAELDLGQRVLQLTAHGVAHSDCDLSVFDPASATLVTGDLLFVRRVPSLDGSLTGWQRELATLKALPARRAVPGHGPVSVRWPAGAADLERYLDVLLRETRSAVRRKLDLGTAVATVGRSERNRWLLFDAYQGHNVTRAFQEVEWE